ncbi:hypothetical protein HYH03_012127 [Edaphochlamys debaryana]|uniref:RecA family profile 1 domain-containing protein n=1 Tax=Edaphochlamys debaryana TaxID=47281 RepID=A0A836BUD3_9CHLO|nr:hypothetical protein HYH03_012127 [Edaphochlamys debaryana]|eukprot:KAG2489295.1 hypothetical protein HYH03_012127 [Edaphochlamys debaryana]
MATRQVSRLTLAPQLRDHLTANNLTTARDVLFCGPLDLMELLGLTWQQANALLADVSAQTTPPFTTAWELLTEANGPSAAPLLRTGLPTLDSALRRGVPAGSITELVGPGGVGKSQFCHSMAAAVSLPAECGGLGAGVVYIDTERKFSAARLQEMLNARIAAAQAARAEGHRALPGPGPIAAGAAAQAMQRVVVLSPASTEELSRQIELLPDVVLRHHARLVVVDSIAALARTEYGNAGDRDRGGGGGASGLAGNIMDRQQVLGRIAAQLKAAAESLALPVLVVNQVTTRISRGPQPPGPGAASGQAPGPGPAPGSGGGGDGSLGAALGLKWAHCVNTRLVLQRVGERRFLKVAKSPACAAVILEYVIGPTGLQQVDNADLPEVLYGNALAAPILNELDYGANDAWAAG